MKNIHRVLFLFALIKIVQCEVKDAKIWSNTDPSSNFWSNSGNSGQNENIWSSSGNNGQSEDIWSNSGQNNDIWSSSGNSGQTGSIWSNSGNSGQNNQNWINSGSSGQNGNIWSGSGNNGQNGNSGNNGPSKYASNYQDNNVNYGYNVQNGNADVWFSSLVNNKNPWGSNNNYKLTGIHQQNNNGWNQVQSSWNNQQGSNPQPYFYPRPTQPISNPEANNPTTEQPSASTSAPSQGGNYYIPQTNFYQNQVELSNDIQSAIQQFPVIDLTQSQENVPQSEPLVMMNITQQSAPQEESMMSVNAQPAVSSPQSNSVPDGQQNLVQQFDQSVQFLPKPELLVQQNPVPSEQTPNLNSQQNQGNTPSGNMQQQNVQFPIFQQFDQSAQLLPKPKLLVQQQPVLSAQNPNLNNQQNQNMPSGNIQQQNLIPLPILQQLIQAQQFFSKPESSVQQNPAPSAQISNFNNLQYQPSGNIQQQAPWQYLPFNPQSAANSIGQQNTLPNNLPVLNENQDQFNIPANVELLAPFNSNKPNGNFPGNSQATGLQFPTNPQNFPVFNAPPLITVPNFPVQSQIAANSLTSSKPANTVTPDKREAPLPSSNPTNIQILNSSPLIQVPVSQMNSPQTVFDLTSSVQSKNPVISQPQQVQFQNPFISLSNGQQQQINLPVHPGYNYGLNGNPWINVNAVQQQVANSVDADNPSKRMKRSYEVYEEGTDIDHNLINRMWFNGHGYPTANGERRYVIITNKNKDVQRKDITEAVETTTQKEIVSDAPLNSKKVEEKISNNIDKDNSKIVDLK